MPRYAAIDIGSNSVRLLVADVSPDPKKGTRVLGAERSVTRLGESVFRNGRISEDAMRLVLEQLQGMEQTYRGLDVIGVRAVATSAVRDASNQQEFLERASLAAGTPVEIISGQEEARLVHLGVQSRWPHPRERVLMVDVGGGSAEFILSEKGQLVAAFSKPLGAVRLTEVFLKHDPPEPQELHRLDGFIEEKLSAPLRRIGAGGFDRVIATSATAAAAVCAINRVPRDKREEADRLRASTSQIRKLYAELIGRNLAGRRKIDGIGPRRAEIIIAGTAVFLRALEAFQHHSMYYLAAGVRDGIVADLAARGVGRELSHMNRDQHRVIEDMAHRYAVSLKHARKVAALAHDLFEAMHPLHHLPPSYGKLLEAAAYLHDIGHYVSDVSHHKHSAYLIAHGDMPGFTDTERQFIAALCRYHRKAMPAQRHAGYQSLSPDERRALMLLTPILRIADSLDRGQHQRVERVDGELRNGSFVLSMAARGDATLEQWAAERAGDSFRQVYNTPLQVVRARSAA
jgi:exopolyphosphatase / guanosine-5'-triphosphate,3'-diphosphate pyrophosphatase